MAADAVVEIEGRRLSLSNLDKVLYPSGFTKAEVISYYAEIGPTLLTHLGDRALTLRRFPDGSTTSGFFEKHCPDHRPEWIGTHQVSRPGHEEIAYCRIDSLAALTWAANLAALELHTSMARADDPDTPTMVVFDLDPGAPADVVACAEVALWIGHALDDLGLESVAKTSGSKGLQVYLPLNTPTTYEATSAFARTMAQVLERQHPDRVVSTQVKARRVGRVLVDWSQNSWPKTTVCVYSLRARDTPTVSTPVTWSEVDAAVKAGDPSRLRFEAADVLRRVGELGDLFAPTLSVRQTLPS